MKKATAAEAQTISEIQSILESVYLNSLSLDKAVTSVLFSKLVQLAFKVEGIERPLDCSGDAPHPKELSFLDDVLMELGSRVTSVRNLFNDLKITDLYNNQLDMTGLDNQLHADSPIGTLAVITNYLNTVYTLLTDVIHKAEIDIFGSAREVREDVIFDSAAHVEDNLPLVRRLPLLLGQINRINNLPSEIAIYEK